MTSSVLKFVIIKAVQGTCLRSNWCEVLLLHKSQYLNKDTKERKKVSLKLNENYLDIPSVSTTERISKLKDGCNKLEAIKNRKLRCDSQLWYRKYYLSQLQQSSLGNKNGKAIKSFCLSMQGWCGNYRMKRN